MKLRWNGDCLREAVIVRQIINFICSLVKLLDNTNYQKSHSGFAPPERGEECPAAFQVVRRRFTLNSDNMIRRLIGGCSLLQSAILLGMVQPAVAQIALSGSGPGNLVRIFNTDMAVLEVQEARKDLPCEVNPSKALIGFDLRFHAGYQVTVPLKELAGGENTLTILFRVTPAERNDETSYFIQRFHVPVIEEDAKGEAYLQGTLDLGEGKYHIDWLMRDRSERVCSSYWDVEAVLPPKDRSMNLVLMPGSVRPAESEQFREEPPVERIQGEQPLNVKVLINFAPQNSHSATLQPLDTAALVSILRSIARDPRIGKFSIVAFNMQEQRVVYRQEMVDKIDFPALGEALSSLRLGTVDLRRLSQKHGETEFLTELIKQEVGSAEATDALIFAGPKVMLDANVPQEDLREVGEVDYPVFYMNYNLYPQTTPWRDSISHAVKFFKGQEFTITRPRDLWNAVSEMVARIVKFRHSRPASGASSQ